MQTQDWFSFGTLTTFHSCHWQTVESESHFDKSKNSHERNAQPNSYGCRELDVEDTDGKQNINFATGELLIYPGTSLHQVEPVTRGERLACFF